ncbi:hypothetical protein Herbaro_09410 [Herbaspirillum sp. WKF16]|uniref:hypothetical protein n=1 Tax=Herbaspirillum sp. WKF16 TaxID=3028312 RepID=UPI0023A9A56B|nr:hypothetical protein [Herbaspirillum sp. WKF16]WDZ97977.1 hypothetical protein Herbaro_09410 [Herbaspirillum sp. WKF16]
MSDASNHREAFHLLCHEKIGGGMSREVYSSKILPDCVIKIEDGAGQFQNIVEWETWRRVMDTPFSRWFAACRWISPNGQILIMERTARPSPADFPEKMPVFLCDFKRDNFGLSTLIDQATGKPSHTFVCHDYGTNMLFERGMTKRMQTVEWWDP